MTDVLRIGTAVVCGGAAVLFLALTVQILVHQRRMRRLPPLAAGRAAGSDTRQVTCSIVVPARDEGARLEATIRRLLGQQGVNVEVIAVDDRSVDGTIGILQRLASEDARVRSVRIDSLPDGWLGKCHACHVGAGIATGEWILFTDADCWLQADVIARALQVAEQDAADHITLNPGVTPATIPAGAWHLALLSSMASLMAGVNRDRPGAHLGMGAFNLVRADAYRDCGGYAALRLTILDDVKLGLLLHRAGKRTRAFLGSADAQCHWGTTVASVIKIMEKNYFAIANFSAAAIAGVTLLGVMVLGAAAVGPWTGTPAGIAAGLAFWSMAIPAAVMARRLRWPYACAVMAPLMYAVLIYAAVNSAVVTLRQGGVRWRDTFYPIEVLRKGSVR